MEYVKLINEIESELAMGYIPHAINWCDENFDNAWSKAIDRFDYALSLAIERMDFQLAEKEAKVYRFKILELIGKYKKNKDMNEQQSFLEALRDRP